MVAVRDLNLPKPLQTEDIECFSVMLALSDQRTQLRALIEDYKSSQRVVSEEMQRTHLAVWFADARRMKSSPEYDEYKHHMDRLQDQRRLLAQRLVDALTPLVSADHSVEFLASVTIWKAAVADHKPDDFTILYKP